MARPPLDNTAPVDVRALLIEKYRTRIERTPEFRTSYISGGGCYCCPWHGYVRALEAGHPFVCQRWQLPREIRDALPPGDFSDWYTLVADELTRIESPIVRDGTEEATP